MLQCTNRKINIVVIMIIVRMAETTTIPVSKQFHEWLKSKGKKGESYEAIIKRMINSDALQDLEEPH